jgi:hypothetical protein
LGWVGYAFKYSPIQPVTLGILAAELITSAIFAAASWLKRTGSRLRGARLFRFQ